MTGIGGQGIPIQEAVEPFIVVKGKKRRWLDEGEMGDENSTIRVKKKGRKGKGKGKAKEEPVQDGDMREAGDDGSPTPPIAEDALEDDPRESVRPEIEELVIVVHKIDSFETPQDKYLVFSAVGYVLCFPHLRRAQLKFYSKLYVSFCLRFPLTR
jgi:tRNA (guanine-N(7)-)-methyltransferase subunit TRM82